MDNYLPYAGIGSRQTPANICNLMTRIAIQFEAHGFTLRSGGADHADTAFENGISNAQNMEIYIPWDGYNGRHSRQEGVYVGWPNSTVANKALDLAAQFHPAWNRCSPGTKKLHARNMAQVLGQNLLSPAKLVICWTPNGQGGGGTGQAIRAAKHYGIPVFDLGDPDLWQCLDQLKDFANSLIE